MASLVLVFGGVLLLGLSLLLEDAGEAFVSELIRWIGLGSCLSGMALGVLLLLTAISLTP